MPRNLRAAAAASALGLSSLDGAKKRYTHDEETGSATASDRYLQAYFAARNHMRETLEALGDFGEEDNYGAYAAAIALQRLESGFRAAHILYRLGLNIEGDTISRQILEQIAWSLEASKLRSLDEIEKVNASYSITALKGLIPGTGPFYGALSDIAHAGLQQHREHVEVGPDDQGQIVMARGRLATSAAVLLRLADAWVAVCEYAQRDIVSTFRALMSADDLRLNSDRPFLAQSQTFVRDIEELESLRGHRDEEGH